MRVKQKEQSNSLTFAQKMGKVFEEFVKRFCFRPTIDWFGAEGSVGALDHLAQMRTDIVLKSSEHTIIVDTFTVPLTQRYEVERI